MRIGMWLVGTTMAYNAIEAVIALWSGVVAESSALVGFGFDSIIEILAVSVLLWRLGIEAGGAGVEVIEATE